MAKKALKFKQRHVYPSADSKTSQVAYRDREHFDTHPGISAFIREYIPGEFEGIPIPDGMDIQDIARVLVKRINVHQQARIPLTHEQAARIIQELGTGKDTTK